MRRRVAADTWEKERICRGKAKHTSPPGRRHHGLRGHGRGFSKQSPREQEAEYSKPGAKAGRVAYYVSCLERSDSAHDGSRRFLPRGSGADILADSRFTGVLRAICASGPIRTAA